MSAFFDPNNTDTWPVLMRAHHVAAIFDLSISQLNRKVSAGQFRPAPAAVQQGRALVEIKPRRWRRDDVLAIVRAA